MTRSRRPEPRLTDLNLAERLQRLEDEAAIRAALDHLCQAADRRQLADYLAIYDAEATFEIAGQSFETGIEAIRAGTEARWQQTPRGMGRHLLTGAVIEVTGDTARSHACITIVGPGAAGPAVLGQGVYEDVWRRTALGWKLTRHVIRTDG